MHTATQPAPSAYLIALKKEALQDLIDIQESNRIYSMNSFFQSQNTFAQFGMSKQHQACYDLCMELEIKVSALIEVLKKLQ